MTKSRSKTAQIQDGAKLPFWQTTPCPHWCEVGHKDHEEPADRRHSSEAVDRVLFLHSTVELLAGEVFYETPFARMYLEQNWREVEAYIWLGQDESNKGFKLTLDEAQTIGEHLLDLVRQAHSTAGDAP
jgi:hypothetical protein